MQFRTFFIILVTALLSQSVLAGNVHSSPGSVGLAKLGFSGELQTGDDVQLRGLTANSVLQLKLPPRYRPSGSGSLHLLLRHSPGLNGDKSFLTVTLNYALLRSIRLDETNAEITEITIPIPSSAIQQTNSLALAVDQVDGSGAPLTVISSRSFLEFPYAETPVQWDLADLRTTLSSPALKPSEQPALLVPINASSSTLEAAALIAANLIAHSADSSHAFKVVHRLTDWSGPLFVIGTPSEQPELTALQRTAPISFYRGRDGILITPAGDHSTNAIDGYIGIALDTQRHAGPVIFVSGNSPAAVLKAAKALTSPNWSAAGKFARVASDATWPARRMREWDQFIPPTNSFRLSDLTHNDIPIAYPDGAKIALRTTPDSVFLSYGHEVKLQLTLSSEFYLPSSFIVVQLNGSELGRYSVSDNLRGREGALRIKIPAKLLVSDNVLKILWQGPVTSGSLTTAGWISRDTEFYLPKNYEAQLPDLGLLRQHLYPFSIKADFSDLLIVLPDRVNADSMSALLAAASGIRRLAPSEHVAFHVARSRELLEYELSNFNIIFVTAGPIPPVVMMANTSNATAAKIHERVWEGISPWSTHRWVLVIRAQTPAELLSLTESIFDPAVLNHLTGDTAFIDGKNTICLNLREKRKLGDASYNSAMQAWLREHWLALPVVAILVSTALFLLVRIVLQQNHRVPVRRGHPPETLQL